MPNFLSGPDEEPALDRSPRPHPVMDAGASQPSHLEMPDDTVRTTIRGASDILLARTIARRLASRLLFSSTDLTCIATAVSEVARNILRFADDGEVVVELLHHPRPGVRVVARDHGPGITVLHLALTDGYSTCDGLGLGLPGARRLMDEFALDSQAGEGTTVTMVKWPRRGLDGGPGRTLREGHRDAVVAHALPTRSWTSWTVTDEDQGSRLTPNRS